MLPFYGLVCLSVMFVHWAQTAEVVNMISFAYDSPMSLTDRIKIWLSLVNPFLPHILPQSDPPHLDLTVGDIRWQIADEWLDIQ